MMILFVGFVVQLWYPISKNLAEKAAWDFSKEKGLDVVVVNPGTVMGPVIPPRLNASMLMLVRLLQGNALSLQYVLLAYIVVANGFSGI